MFSHAWATWITEDIMFIQASLAVSNAHILWLVIMLLYVVALVPRDILGPFPVQVTVLIRALIWVTTNCLHTGTVNIFVVLITLAFIPVIVILVNVSKFKLAVNAVVAQVPQSVIGIVTHSFLYN